MVAMWRISGKISVKSVRNDGCVRVEFDGDLGKAAWMERDK